MQKIAIKHPLILLLLDEILLIFSTISTHARTLTHVHMYYYI